MPDPSIAAATRGTRPPTRPLVTIRREPNGYGIRFGLTEAEDEVLHGPVFETLTEALAWIERFDEAHAA